MRAGQASALGWSNGVVLCNLFCKRSVESCRRPWLCHKEHIAAQQQSVSSVAVLLCSGIHLPRKRSVDELAELCANTQTRRKLHSVFRCC